MLTPETNLNEVFGTLTNIQKDTFYEILQYIFDNGHLPKNEDDAPYHYKHFLDLNSDQLAAAYYFFAKAIMERDIKVKDVVGDITPGPGHGDVLLEDLVDNGIMAKHLYNALARGFRINYKIEHPTLMTITTFTRKRISDFKNIGKHAMEDLDHIMEIYGLNYKQV